MRRNVLSLLLSIFTSLSTNAQPSTGAKGTYIAICPETIRPNRPFSLSLYLRKDLPSGGKVEMEIVNQKGEQIASTVVRNATSGKGNTIRIANVPANRLVENGTYSVKIRAVQSGKIIFENTTSLLRDPKYLSTFIQTDKNVYKPGSTVRYRVVVVDSTLRPYAKKISVKITDPNGNIIVQDNNKPLNIGVYANELKLSAEPPLGTWEIKAATQDGHELNQYFDVNKYVLPRFEVTVKRPEGQLMGITNDLVVTVTALYTYGHSVEGEGTVVVDQGYNRGAGYSITKKFIPDISGTTVIRFKNSDLRKKDIITDMGYNAIYVEATVKEPLSGMERSDSIELFTRVVDRTLSLESEYFKPGLNQGIFISLQDMNGNPPREETSKQVVMEVEFVLSVDTGRHFAPARIDQPRTPPPPSSIKETSIVKLENDGTAITHIKDIPATTKTISINVIHREEGEPDISVGMYLVPNTSPSNTFLQLGINNLRTISPDTGLQLTVASTHIIPRLYYQVVTRGLVALTGQTDIDGKTGELNVPITVEMAPSSKIVTFFVRPDNSEIVVSATNFDVNGGFFANKVSLSADPETLEPGGSCQIKVKADPNSYIGLLAVDQSALFLKSGVEFNPSLVKTELALYGEKNCTTCTERIGFEDGRRQKRSMTGSWFITGNDAGSVFDAAALKVMTDALLPSTPGEEEPIEYEEYYGFGTTYEEGAEPVSTEPEPPRTRSNFPETWLWVDQTSSNFTEGRNGVWTYNAHVPDTITSWVISAFAVNQKTGLGMPDGTEKIRVVRPCFIRLNLPYSVKRGNSLALQINIFNYEENGVMVDVTLDHDKNSGFNIVKPDGAPYKVGEDKVYNKRRVKVNGKGGVVSVKFPIVPTKLGDVLIGVTAITETSGDRVQRPLLVEPEGFRVEQNEPVMIDLSKTSSWKQSLTASFPDDAVPDSQSAEVTVVGDLMGPMMENIEELVRMPYGCGEQNMINFVPNIVALRYLKATNRLNADTERKIKNFMEQGYQRELTYKRRDYSFSAFGNSDPQGSTFLTAFVVKSFKQAQEYIYVDNSVIEDSIKFLERKQTPAGEFKEDGQVLHQDLLGGNSKAEKLPITAYILSALLLNGKQNSRGQKYVERNLKAATTPYAAALVAFYLQQSKSRKANKAFRNLEKFKITKGIQVEETLIDSAATGDLTHWEAVRKVDKSPDYWNEPSPADVEITSYALLTYLLRGKTSEALPIVRWLVSKRNSLGGYSSTQDTVMAVQALGTYAEKTFSATSNVEITVTGGNQRENFEVTPENSLVLQSAILNNPKSGVEIKAKGNGVVYAQLSWRYNLVGKKAKGAFDCKSSAKLHEINTMEMKLCCKKNGAGKSGMAVVAIDALSGWEWNVGHTLNMTRKKTLQRADLSKAQTHADLYFSSLGAKKACVDMRSDRVFKVANEKPGIIQVYDYYKPSDRADFEYGLANKAPLGRSCPECWQNMLPNVAASTSSKAGCAGKVDRYAKCGRYCLKGRKDAGYQRWYKRHKAWLGKYCAKSCC